MNEQTTDVPLVTLKLSESAFELIEDSILEQLDATRRKLDDLKSLLEQLRSGKSDPPAAAPCTGIQPAGSIIPRSVSGSIKQNGAAPRKTDPPQTQEEGPLVDDNTNATPMSDEGIRIGRTLGQPFSPTDLSARLDGDKRRACNWIHSWKTKGWIDNCGYGQYRLTESFGAG